VLPRRYFLSADWPMSFVPGDRLMAFSDVFMSSGFYLDNVLPFLFLLHFIGVEIESWLDRFRLVDWRLKQRAFWNQPPWWHLILVFGCSIPIYRPRFVLGWYFEEEHDEAADFVEYILNGRCTSNTDPLPYVLNTYNRTGVWSSFSSRFYWFCRTDSIKQRETSQHAYCGVDSR